MAGSFKVLDYLQHTKVIATLPSTELNVNEPSLPHAIGRGAPCLKTPVI
jgi:hypothetical protein